MSPRPQYATIHAAPPPGGALTPCCGVVPTTLPRGDGVTPNLTAVTCRARPRSPLTEMVRMALVRVPASGASGWPALPHGGRNGHVYDPNCALCAGDADAIANAIACTLADVIAASSGQPNTLTGQNITQVPSPRQTPKEPRDRRP
ncbi:hypothetical protein [Streptomyces sp. NPDC056291]|uniref:hypothetical protein n=1 Tax=Streptomyces sp. NPDC056291 TaxID=3345772 RepID=UPI0035E34912